MSTEWKKPAFLALSCVGFVSSAHGAVADAGDAGADAAPDILVTASRLNQANLKYTERAIDTPRSLTIIPEKLIKDTGSASLVDALRTVPGITFGAAEGGNPVGDRPFLRGADSQGSSYLDGVRDIGAQSRETFAIDSVQVVKGSDSTMGGRGGAGGSINIISKLPKLGDSASADASFGNANYKRVTADINHQIGPMIAVRIEGMWHDQDVAGRDAIWQKRWGIAPSITIGLGTPTRLTASYYHMHSSELPDSGLPYTYVCSATLCNAPAGNFVLSEPVHNVTTLGGQTLHVPYSTYYGLEDRDFRKTNTDQATLRAEHEFANGITVRNTSRYSHTFQGYIFLLPDDSTGNVVGTTTTNTTTNGVTNYTNGGYVWRRGNTRVGTTNSLINQTDLTASLHTGFIKHNIASGLEFSSEDAVRNTYVEATGSTISPRCNSATVARYYCTSLANPNPADPWVNYTSDTSTVTTPIVRGAGYLNVINKGTTRAAYLFDSMEIGDKLIANVGVRYDDFTSLFTPALASATAARVDVKRRDKIWNYQAGLVFKPTRDTTLYGSYSTSATPPNSLLGEGQEGNAVTAATVQSLAPEKTRSFEVGAKGAFFHEQLSLTVALFQTDTDNARVTSDANTVTFIGKKRARGVEVGYNGRITPRWSVYGGYSYIDAKIIDGGFTTLTAAAIMAGTTVVQAAKTVGVVSVNTGKRFPQTAKNSFTMWTSYDLNRKFTIGGGAFYTGRVFGGYSDNRKATQTPAGVVTVTPATTVLARSVPSYWRFDARASYQLTPRVALSVNVNDLTDKRYFSQAYSSHYATVAPGRTVFGTISVNY